MKKILLSILLVMCVTMMVQAQINTNAHWYNGWLNFSASYLAGGKVQMNAMDEGEEHEFILVPVAGKTDTYRVTDGPNDYVNLYQRMAKVVHQKKDGWDVLCFYNAANQLETVMTLETDWNSEKLNVAKWKNMLMGDYAGRNAAGADLQISINWEEVTVNGLTVSYKVETFNGMVTPYIDISGTEDVATYLTGTWEVEVTLDGLVLHSVTFNEDDNWWSRDNKATLELKESNPIIGRFFFASSTLLNDKQFRRFDKKTLRIMRNAILAKHGYRFQSKDLQDYFAKEPWYKPAANNNDVKPSFIEQLNIELIKCEENKSE